MAVADIVRTAARRLPGFRTLQAVRDLARGGDPRRSGLLRLIRPPGLFQPFGDTAVDRYPDVFGFIGAALAGRESAILSVGCSTGEEVFSLRRYAPAAILKGIDISAQRIAICHGLAAEQADARIAFAVAGDTDGEPASHYDAVFAMAVFRHGSLSDGPPDCGHLLSFAQFEAAMEGLARCLKPGGYLAIRHANFRFADTPVARDFTPVLSAVCESPLYDRNHRLLPAQPAEACVFRKEIAVAAGCGSCA